MTRHAKVRILTLILGVFALGALSTGCGSWQPSAVEGKCSEGRKWVPAQENPETGDWTEGYCEWLPGEK